MDPPKMTAAPLSTIPLAFPPPENAEIVEVSLLLTAGRLEALMTISRGRGETVGQFLRDLIDEALDNRGLRA